MIVQRKFQSKPGQVVYHYCSAASFDAIIRSKKIRFSDVNALNDYGEMWWGYKIFEEAATRLLKDPAPVVGLNKDYLDAVDAVLAPHQLIAHPLVACFSEAADTLSQWRAYADDGRGFAIGFDAEAVAAMPAHFVSIQYDRETQVREMMASLAALFGVYKDEGGMKGEAFHTAVAIAGDLYAFKNPAFHEEKEVRGIHLLSVTADKTSVLLKDEGGTSGDGRPIDGVDVQFRMLSDGVLVPFIDLGFEGYADRVPVKEVYIGPKNQNRTGNVKLFLSHMGLGAASIKRSAATYR